MGNANDDHLDAKGPLDPQDGEDRFWSELCKELGRADAASSRELAEAEQLLAGLDDAEASPLDAATIEQLHRTALSEALPAAATPASTPVEQRAAPVLTGRFRGFFAAAAAVVVAPKFLAAAALVTVAAATTNYFLQSTTQSLPFIEAIEILVNQEAVDASRESAQGRVAFDVAESLQAVRVLDREEPPLRQHADKVRAGLRARLGADPVFVVRHFDATLDELVDVMLDPAADLDDRHDALDALARQMEHGLAALLWVRGSLPPALLEQNRVWLMRLEEMLQ